MNSKKQNRIELNGGALDTQFRCAADVDYVDGSCYSIDQLKLLATIINKSIKKNILKGDQIKIINNKHFLLEQLKDRLKDCKNDQTCWLKKKFVKSSNEISMEDVFRPNGTTGKIEWLSTENIDNVMEQYERKYTDYFFYGAVPVDFHEINYNKLGKVDYDDLMVNGDKDKNDMMREFAFKKFYWKYFEILQIYNKFRGRTNKYPFAEFHNDMVKTNDNEIKKNLDNFFNSNEFNIFIQNFTITQNNDDIEINQKENSINLINNQQSKNESYKKDENEKEELPPQGENNKYKKNKLMKDENDNNLKKSDIAPVVIAATAATAAATILMSNQDIKNGMGGKGSKQNNLISVDKVKKIIYDQIIDIKNKKYPITKIGIVPNLDEHWQSGSHWVALYADLVKGNIYFFDSYGYRPEPRLRGLAKRIAEWKYKKDTGKKLEFDVEDYMTENNKKLNEIEKKYDIRYSTIRNQYKNSECGVYSMNFIIRLLNGSKFDDIIKKKLDDDIVNQCREIYFNNQKIIAENSKENFVINEEKGGKIDIGKKNYKCE
jgi:hypothetical protein